MANFNKTGVVITHQKSVQSPFCDSELQRLGDHSTGDLLRWIIGALLIGSALSLGALQGELNSNPMYLWGPLLMFCIGLIGAGLLRVGKVQACIKALTVGVGVGVALVAAFTGGPRSPMVVVFPVIIMVFGWLTHAQAGIRAGWIFGLMTLALWACQTLPGFAEMPLPPPRVYVLEQLIVFGLATVLIVFILRAYDERLHQLNQASLDLAQYTHLLEQNTTLLERAQGVANVGSWVGNIPSGVIRLSEQACKVVGIAEGQALSWPDFIARVHPEDRERVAAAWDAALTTGVYAGEHRIMVGNAVRWVAQKAEMSFDSHDKPHTALGIIQDITERKLSSHALHEVKERYRTMIEWTPEAILVHRQGVVLYANPAAVKLFGCTDLRCLVGKPTQELIHPDYQDQQRARMNAIMQGDKVPPTVESRFVQLNGNVIDVEVQGTVISYDDEPAIHVNIRDITERKRMADEIKHLAFYDALTQLPNRRLLDDRLQQGILANRRNTTHGAMIFIDLDNFKPLNDTHGHAVGDLLLTEVAKRLLHCVRDTDTVARFGGDEFVVLLTELQTLRTTSQHDAYAVAKKIKSSMADPFHLTVAHPSGDTHQIEHQCTASLGLVVYPGDDMQPDKLLKWADAAMYQAKQEGRNRIVLSEQPTKPCETPQASDPFQINRR